MEGKSRLAGFLAHCGGAQFSTGMAYKTFFFLPSLFICGSVWLLCGLVSVEESFGERERGRRRREGGRKGRIFFCFVPGRRWRMILVGCCLMLILFLRGKSLGRSSGRRFHCGGS